MIVLAFFLSFAAWTALACAMNRHRRDLGWGPASPMLQGFLRIVGGMMLTGALWTCAAHWGWSLGIVAWFGMMTASAGMLVLALSFRAQFRYVSSYGRNRRG